MSDATTTLVVIAKTPLPGKAKTRLSPPCSPAQASELARLALEDTLAAVAEAPAARRIVALEGRPGSWLPSGFDVIPQRGDGLAERIANVFAELEAPTLLVGMDTPQLTAEHLARAIERLNERRCEAVLGPTDDGGYWAIGMKRPEPAALQGVPMSSDRTFAIQRRRLEQLGSQPTVLERLRDVDEFTDALAVAAAAPNTRFARGLRLLAPRPAAMAK